MDDYTLGQAVLFTRTLTRRSRWDDTQRVTVKRWEPEGYPGEPEPAPRRGVVVGTRVLSNGHAVWMGYEEGSEWRGVHYFTAYLVAWHLRRKPVLVLPQHLTPAPPLEPAPELIPDEPDHPLEGLIL